MARFLTSTIFVKLLFISVALVGCASSQDDASTTTEETADPCDPVKLGCPCNGIDDKRCDIIEGESYCKNIRDVDFACDCKEGHVGRTGENKCHVVATKEDDNCEISEQCTDINGLGELSECNNEKKCKCKDTKNPDSPKDVIYDDKEKLCVYDESGDSSSVNLTVSFSIILMGLIVSRLFDF